MPLIVQHLWLIPALPLLAAGVLAILRKEDRTHAAPVAIGAMGIAFLLSLIALFETLGQPGYREAFNFNWLSLGDTHLQLGWVLDPLTASMLVMVTFVGGLIFIFSIGYMAHDENFLRFFCFLSLFAAAMLGLIIANNLLLLFMCWELVGLASYLLIGFWFHKPSAASAAKKAFLTTRIGDLGFLLGMVWLYAETGTLLFYDGGNGCLEQSALTKLVTGTVGAGMLLSTAISLLIFCGAIGKSGQFPLHVWLPDAMEGPTPVSALIHAATMVAAGVFLMARIYPLLEVQPVGVEGVTSALQVITWIGSITALMAALIAVGQYDIKRILAYSTVSQLGFMFIGLGTGGVAVAMFHLLTHAFFKALLFLGAGSVIHGCHEEQDIRKLGGVAKHMPLTFVCYTFGMLALAGFPLIFSGFWSKDEILHSAWAFAPSKWPFFLGVAGAFLTAFYMSRQMFYVFSGNYRGTTHAKGEPPEEAAAKEPHESPPVMTRPLVVLAVFAVGLGFLGTPLWPWLQSWLEGRATQFGFHEFLHAIPLMLLSAVIVLGGLLGGWWYYGLISQQRADEPDPLERKNAEIFGWLKGRFFIDELYQLSVIRWAGQLAQFAEWLDRRVLDGVVWLTGRLTTALAWCARIADEYLVNAGFDSGCRGLRQGGGRLGGWQGGQVQSYLRVFGVALVVVVLVLAWGGAR
jgi:NADH-quinone oxidoreductase subunit L